MACQFWALSSLVVEFPELLIPRYQRGLGCVDSRPLADAPLPMGGLILGDQGLTSVCSSYAVCGASGGTMPATASIAFVSGPS